MVGQVGTATSATKFLQEIGNESKIADVVFVASGRLTVHSRTSPNTIK